MASDQCFLFMCCPTPASLSTTLHTIVNVACYILVILQSAFQLSSLLFNPHTIMFMVGVKSDTKAPGNTTNESIA